MKTVKVFAPAKINLTLHITGRRDDGYHLIDSLVAFAPVGDRLVIQAGNTLSLTVEGPEAAGVPADMNNLALKAAMMASQGAGAALTLTKFLPAASGIGGGSSDAAAAFRGMLAIGETGQTTADTIWAMPEIIVETHARALLALGADVPMCLLPAPARVRGIGERIQHLQIPALPAVLVNPRVPVSTGEVFRNLVSRENPEMPAVLPAFGDAADLIDFLATCRNDLEGPALAIVPSIGDVLDCLAATDGCRLARMSGSGATCFGLYGTEDEAKDALRRIAAERPDWWLAGGVLGDQTALALPKDG